MAQGTRGAPIDVLIIGAGMHVCGRGTKTCGTVLPAVVQANRDGLVGRMVVAATSAGSVAAFEEKLDALNRRLGTAARFEGLPTAGRDPEAWRKALAEMGGRACVVIVVPDDLHVPMASEAMRCHLPVLVEKPLGTTVESCRDLRDRAARSGLVVQVGNNRRFRRKNPKKAASINISIGPIRSRPHTPSIRLYQFQSSNPFIIPGVQLPPPGQLLVLPVIRRLCPAHRQFVVDNSTPGF